MDDFKSLTHRNPFLFDFSLNIFGHQELNDTSIKDNIFWLHPFIFGNLHFKFKYTRIVCKWRQLNKKFIFLSSIYKNILMCFT